MAIKFGWMEIMDVLLYLKQNHEITINGFNHSIIPMVLIPLTAVTVFFTSLAGIIAGWFGIKLHTEGPKQFLEVLLKKRVLISIIVFNCLSYASYQGYIYFKNMPRFISTIKSTQNKYLKLSEEVYANNLYRPFSYNGKINNLKLKNVTLTLENKFPKGAIRSGVITKNNLLFGLEDGFIYEIAKNNLSIVRKFFIGTSIVTRPIIFNGKIYSGEGAHDNHHARVYAFDSRTGKYINSFQTKGHTEGQPTIAILNNIASLFVVSGLDGLYSIDPESMQVKWHQNDGHLDASIIVENDRVYAGTGVEKGNSRERSYAVAYDFLTGKKIWKTELPLSNWMHPVLTTHHVCYSLGEIYFPSEVGFIYCVDKKTGVPQFSIPFSTPIASKPYFIKSDEKEMVFVAGFNGEICGVDLIKKEKMWCHQTGNNKTHYSLASFDYDSKRGLLVYPSMDNGIYFIRPLTGEIEYHWLPKNDQLKWKTNFAAVTIDGDDIYLIDTAGQMRKFKID